MLKQNAPYASRLCRGNKKRGGGRESFHLKCQAFLLREFEENLVARGFLNSPAASPRGCSRSLCIPCDEIVMLNVRWIDSAALLRKFSLITGKLSISAICYDLHARQLQRTPMRQEKLHLRNPLKIQRMLSASLVKIDGSSMSLMGARES